MRKYIRIGVISLVLVFALAFSASAAVYSDTVPQYVPVSGGAFLSVDTSVGTATFVASSDYIYNTFGFSGTGFQVCNLTSSTVTGTLYSVGTFGFYGNPTSVQARFQSMGTLQIYQPYENNYGGTSYSWVNVTIESVTATNIALEDTVGLDRQNNALLYTRVEKILIIILCVLIGLLLYKLLRRGWYA